MGVDYRIDLYLHRSDNSEFPVATSELPNRYEPMVYRYWYGEGKWASPIGKIFNLLLEKKAGDIRHAHTFVKVTADDFDFLSEELTKLQDSDFHKSYPREFLYNLLDEWKAYCDEWEPSVDMYFFWC